MQLTTKKEENYSSDALISGIKNKDREVLEYIYKSYFPMIIDYVGKNSGTREDAKDVFHDGLTAIYEKTQKGDVTLQSNFKTYLYAICKNLWLMTLRRKKTAMKVETKENLMISQPIGIEEDIMDQQRYKLFRAYFTKLGEDCQKVLGLFFKGTSLKEIGAEMGFTESYAKKKKFICQKQLIESIENDQLYNELLMS